MRNTFDATCSSRGGCAPRFYWGSSKGDLMALFDKETGGNVAKLVLFVVIGLVLGLGLFMFGLPR